MNVRCDRKMAMIIALLVSSLVGCKSDDESSGQYSDPALAAGYGQPAAQNGQPAYDQAGQPIYDQNGQPVYNPAGQPVNDQYGQPGVQAGPVRNDEYGRPVTNGSVVQPGYDPKNNAQPNRVLPEGVLCSMQFKCMTNTENGVRAQRWAGDYPNEPCASPTLCYPPSNFTIGEFCPTLGATAPYTGTCRS